MPQKFLRKERLRGNFPSVIYRAFSREYGDVVLKRLITTETDGVTQNLRQIRQIGQTTTPKLYDICEDMDERGEFSTYLVMEYVGGQNLEEIVQERQYRNAPLFSDYELILIARKLAGKIASCHRMNPPFIHGKITPYNLLFQGGEEIEDVCLMGWGTGHGYDHQDDFFVAPEWRENQLEYIDNPDLWRALDIYSLGATLYSLAWGADIERRLWDQPPDIRKVRRRMNPTLGNVIMTCMYYYPMRRYSSMEEVEDALSLDHLLGESSLWKGLLRKQRMVRIGLLGGIACSLVLISSGWFLLGRGQEQVYVKLLEQMEEDIESNDYLEATASYEKARKIHDDRPNLYYQQALNLYLQGKAQEAAGLLEGHCLTSSKLSKEEERNACLLYAEVCVALENYRAAEEYYRKVLSMGEADSAVLVNYVSTLAMDNQVELAREVLQNSIENGMGTDAVYYANGQIEYSDKNYGKAKKAFEKCLSQCEDPERKRDCYLKIGKCIEGDKSAEPDYGELISLYTRAGEDLPSKYLREIDGLLLRAYIQRGLSEESKGYNEKAYSLYTRMQNEGNGTFSDAYYLAVNFINMEDMENASLILSNMVKNYGQKYETYIACSFYDWKKQEKAQNPSFDKFKAYYEKMRKLKDQQAKDVSDEQVNLLQELYESVQEEENT